MMSISKLALFGAGLACFAHGHILMLEPPPYGTPQLDPLNGDGSNYPCQTNNVNNFAVTKVTSMAIGQAQTLTFQGSAVHNGGSCQLSLTSGHSPTANSTFKVIYSILGSCPGVNGVTNTYQYSVPAEVPNGDYSFAWTWYNNIGNREIYMNCAPITVTGSVGTEDTFNSLPDMAIYNLADQNTCKTVETFDVEYANPGKYVTTGASYKPTPVTSCAVAAVSSAAPQVASATSSVATTTTLASASTTSITATIASSASHIRSNTTTITTTATTMVTSAVVPSFGHHNGTVAGTVPAIPGTEATAISSPLTIMLTSGTATPTSTLTVTLGPESEQTGGVVSPLVATTIASSTAAATAANTASVAPGVGTGTGSAEQTCSGDGTVVCSADGTMFGLCNFGLAHMQPVAAGTKCAGGQILKRYVVPQGGRAYGRVRN